MKKYSKLFKKLLIASFQLLIIGYLFTATAYAQAGLPEPKLPQSPASKLQNADSLPSTIINLFIVPVLAILGFMAVLYIFLAALKFIRSGGDPKAAAEARARLTYAIVGLVVIILSVILTQIIDKLILGGTGTI